MVLESDCLLTLDECKYIKSLWSDTTSLTTTKATIDTGNHQINYKSVTSSKHLYSSDTFVLNILRERLSKFNVNPTSITQFQILKYTKGDFLGRHKDVQKYPHGTLYKTLVVQLSNPAEYTGGDLIIFDTPVEKKQGKFTFVKSNEIHEVTEVLDGERFSLVLFILHEDINNIKSLL